MPQTQLATPVLMLYRGVMMFAYEIMSHKTHTLPGNRLSVNWGHHRNPIVGFKIMSSFPHDSVARLGVTSEDVIQLTQGD